MDTVSTSLRGSQSGTTATAAGNNNANTTSTGNEKNASSSDAKNTQQQLAPNQHMADSSIVDPMISALWGVVPIQAKLFPGDMKPDAVAPPPDKELLVPRQGFLIYHMDVLRAHFSPYAANIHSLWLSVKDESTGMYAFLPWYLPTHVIMDRVMSRSAMGPVETHIWGKNFLPLVLYVHFTMPPVAKKKQRGDLCAQPETLLTLRDQPGIATLHLYRWLKEVYMTRFNDLEGFEGESRQIKNLGLRILRAAKDNDPQVHVSVRRDVQQRTSGEVGFTDSFPYCVVIHTFDATHNPAASKKPVWRSKTCRIQAVGRTLGRVLPELIPALDVVPNSVFAKDEILPHQYGSVFVQGLQPLMTTPLDVLYEMFQSVDLALHIVWRPTR